MNKSHLVACVSCARHVRVSEAACPFCGAVLPDSLRSTPRREPPGVRLSRAALFAFGTGTLALSPACSSSSSGNSPAVAGADDASAADDASTAMDGSHGTVGADAAYGSPGIVEDVDAAEFDGTTTLAAYGGAILDAETVDGDLGLDAAYGSPSVGSGDGGGDAGRD